MIDQTFTPSAGQLAAREVDDTTIYDDTGTFELNLAAASGVPGKLERAGVWLQVTDVLVMTANSADELMDIAYADGNNHTVLWTKNAVRIVMPWSSYRPIAWAVARDPRCNHKDWQWFDALEPSGYNWTADATVGLATSVAFGMQDKLRKAALTYIENTCKNGNLSIAKDLEPLLDFTTGATGTGVVQTSKTFSTAFIPNHPITSLWQLGAVSRGVPGQTINLKKYGGPKGDLKYSDGDAWLLDYFKLNELDDKAPIRGKFNPNCFNEASYEFLFSNIPFNADPNETDVYEPGKLDDTTSPQLEYNEFYKDLIDGSTSATCHDIEGSGKVFDFNSSINLGKDQSWSPVEAVFNFVEIQSGSTGVNDRMAESLIGCTAGLLSTRYEYFTVFAVGQSVKWLGAEFDAMDNAHHNAIKDQIINPIQINNGTTNNWYSVLSTQMHLMTIERDCWFNTMRVVRTQLY